MLHFLFSPLCLGCNEPLRHRQAFCFRCTKVLLRGSDFPCTLFDHEGPGRGFVAALRGQAPHRMAAWACALLRRRGQLASWANQGIELVVHAPQNPRRESSGLAILSESIARFTGAQYLGQAFRKKTPRTQHGRSLGQRMDTRCFIELARPEKWVKGKHILLLDDVLTTGTTLDLCSYVLRKAGASKVARFTLARQVVPGFEGKHEKTNEESREVPPLLLELGVEVGKKIGGSNVEESAGRNGQSGAQEHGGFPA